jgi:DNA-binding transcriptional regulator LsrR (DeoR family)
VPAILGALRGGYLDVLVTTEDVARALLAAEGVEA